MYLYLKIKFIFIALIFVFISSLHAEAATLELVLDKNITSSKEDINMLITINSEEQDINTAQATISFPTNLLEVIKIDRIGTVLSFWLEEPNYDNTKGIIRFVGGSTSGFSGQSLKVMKISFKVKGSGAGRIGVSDAAITASDGAGSNVYTTSKGLDINIPTSADFQAVQVERAQRAITLAKKLPTPPNINIPFYPDPEKWNNRSASFQASWNIETDITKAGMSLSNKSVSTPSESNEALLGHKIFPALADGVWYLHLRVANNIGWGAVNHYRIAVDTTPPNPFKILSENGFETKDPKPVINFTSSDTTSSIDKYIIKLNDTIASSTNQNKYQFEPLLPGRYRLTVSAVDKAGNSISESETLEILPILSPSINYLSQKIIVDESGITAGGVSTPRGEVIVQVQNAQKQVVFEQTVPTDDNGNWNVVVNKSLVVGDYYLRVTARDENMASSLPVISDVIKVKIRPMLTFGNFEITQMWFFVYLIIILLFSFGMGWFSYHNWKGRLDRRLMIASRDVANVLDNTTGDIDKLLKNNFNNEISKSHLVEIEYTLKKIKKNLEKSSTYIIDNIREISKK